MKNRFEEIQKCLQNELYEAALGLALTLPDICGDVEYPNTGSKKRYIDWLEKYLPKTVLSNSLISNLKKNTIGDRTIEPLMSKDIYSLRCKFLHNGNDDIDKDTIQEFHLKKPESMGKDKNGIYYGYHYWYNSCINGDIVHCAEINVFYLCKELCEAAEKYYSAKSPSDFDKNSLIID